MDLLIKIRDNLKLKMERLGGDHYNLVQEFENDMDKVRRNVRETLMKKCVMATLKAGKGTGDLQELYDSIKGTPSKESKGLFVTINFDDKKIVPKDIPSYMTQLLKKKWIQNYEYTIEQRNETEGDYKGFHVHLLLTDHVHKRKSEVIREFYSSMKKYLGSKQSIDCRPVNNPQGVVKYMEGEKKDEWKLPKVENDKRMRKHYEFADVYKLISPSQ